jgi:hypothetical protein
MSGVHEPILGKHLFRIFDAHQRVECTLKLWGDFEPCGLAALGRRRACGARRAVYVKPRGRLGSAYVAFISRSLPGRLPAPMRYIERAGTAGFPRPSAQPPDHPRHTEGINPMADAVAAATQLHPASPGDGADRLIRPAQTEGWRAGTTSAAASRLRSPT